MWYGHLYKKILISFFSDAEVLLKCAAVSHQKSILKAFLFLQIQRILIIFASEKLRALLSLLPAACPDKYFTVCSPKIVRKYALTMVLFNYRYIEKSFYMFRCIIHTIA